MNDRSSTVEELGMQSGLLWFDDNPSLSLADKIERAAGRYREKFGKSPTVCFVHPQTLEGAERLPAHVKVIERGSIQPNNFWIGVNSS